MFDKIQHIGYLTADLDAAVAWFAKSFGAVIGGGGPLGKIYAVPSGGRNAYVRFGQVEAEIIEPEDKEGLSGDGMSHHGNVRMEPVDTPRVLATVAAAAADNHQVGLSQGDLSHHQVHDPQPDSCDPVHVHLRLGPYHRLRVGGECRTLP